MATEAVPVTAPARVRLLGVDVARGLAVVGMLLVDNRGNDAIGRQLVHAPWHGLRVADVVFPLFLLLVGVSMPLSRRAQRPRQALLRVLRLAGLGWLVVTAKYGSLTSGVGVLGHIAGAYLLCWLLLGLPRRSQVPVAAAVLVALGVAVRLSDPHAGGPGPAPGSAPGSASGSAWAAWIDQTLGTGLSAEAPHSYLPSAVTVFLGVFAGRLLQRREGAAADVRLLAAGVPLLCAGLLVAPVVPVNKHLWTPSYVLVTGGIGLVVLVAAHCVVDTRGVRRPFLPLEVVGRNALVAFVVSEVLFRAVLVHGVQPVVDRELTRWTSAPVAAWTYAVISIVVVWSVCALLARRGVVVRV